VTTRAAQRLGGLWVHVWVQKSSSEQQIVCPHQRPQVVSDA